MGKGKMVQFFERELNDLKSLDIWRAVTGEFVGTMLLVILSVGTGLYPSENNGSVAPSSTSVALEAGLYIGVIITVLGTISGGHVNPAISLGFVLTGGITVVRFILYCIAQTIGGVAGAALILILAPAHIRGTLGVIEPASGVADEQALLCEVIISFFLLFGTFAMIDEGRKDMHGSVPLMIGLIVTVNIFFAWNLSGGCMNPARNFGPAILIGNTDKLWIYWVGPLVGAAVGTLLYDKVYSTKVCKRWLSNGCLGKRALPDDDDDDDFDENEPMSTEFTIIDNNNHTV